ncbi:MAG: DUF359 domain-containing protein [Thermoprotei archaeon]
MPSNFTELVWVLPPELRGMLSQPLGDLLGPEEAAEMFRAQRHPLITVGDVVSSEAIRLGATPRVAIVDGKTKRTMKADVPRTGFAVLSSWNPPGTISFDSVCAVREAVLSGRNTLIAVDGEEDLLTIPAVLFAEDGVNVVYGQPDVGVVRLVVGDASRQSVLNILNRFVLKFYE